jgi:hypothetical protein
VITTASVGEGRVGSPQLLDFDLAAAKTYHRSSLAARLFDPRAPDAALHIGPRVANANSFSTGASSPYEDRRLISPRGSKWAMPLQPPQVDGTKRLSIPLVAQVDGNGRIDMLRLVLVTVLISFGLAACGESRLD